MNNVVRINRGNLAVEVLRIIQDYEIPPTRFSYELGKTRSYINQFQRVGDITRPATLDPIIEKLKEKSKILKSAKLQDLESELKRAGLTLAWLARRLGISKQRLHHQLHYSEMSEERKNEIKRVLRQVGSEISERLDRLAA